MQYDRRKVRNKPTPTLHQGKQTITAGYVQRDTSQASQKSEEGIPINASLAASAWNLKKMTEKLNEDFL